MTHMEGWHKTEYTIPKQQSIGALEVRWRAQLPLSSEASSPIMGPDNGFWQARGPRGMQNHQRLAPSLVESLRETEKTMFLIQQVLQIRYLVDLQIASPENSISDL